MCLAAAATLVSSGMHLRPKKVCLAAPETLCLSRSTIFMRRLAWPLRRHWCLQPVRLEEVCLVASETLVSTIMHFRSQYVRLVNT